MLSFLPSPWFSIVKNSFGADFVAGHSLSRSEVVENTRFGFESTKGTTYCNVFAIGLILRRFIGPKCILAFNSGSMRATDILTKLADESRLHYPWIRSLMPRSVYSILMGCSTFLSSLNVSGKQYRSRTTSTVYKHRKQILFGQGPTSDYTPRAHIILRIKKKNASRQFHIELFAHTLYCCRANALIASNAIILPATCVELSRGHMSYAQPILQSTPCFEPLSSAYTVCPIWSCWRLPRPPPDINHLSLI